MESQIKLGLVFGLLFLFFFLTCLQAFFSIGSFAMYVMLQYTQDTFKAFEFVASF